MKRIVAAKLPPAAAGVTLLDYLSGRFAYHSREEWNSKLQNDEIALNGVICNAGDTLLLGNELLEYFPASLVEPEVRRDYKIVFEDDFLLVIDKPGNLPVHPAGPYFAHTLWAFLADSGYGKVHFVNRLDRETSGLLIAAKQAKIAGAINKTLMDMQKCYQVLVHGFFAQKCTASGYLLPDTDSPIRKKQKFIAQADLPETLPSSANAVETIFTPLKSNGKYTLLAAELRTGRMHQIRATLHGMNFPVVGDKLYGLNEQFYRRLALDTLSEADRKELVLPRQALHCSQLSFVHPQSAQTLTFTSGLPEEIAAVLD